MRIAGKRKDGRQTKDAHGRSDSGKKKGEAAMKSGGKAEETGCRAGAQVKKGIGKELHKATGGRKEAQVATVRRSHGKVNGHQGKATGAEGEVKVTLDGEARRKAKEDGYRKCGECIIGLGVRKPYAHIGMWHPGANI